MISFTRLIWRLVQVKHDGQTRHEEEEEHHPEALDALLARECLPEQTEQTEQKRKHVIDVVSLVFTNGSRHVILVAHENLVDELDARDPIAAVDFAVALHVTLTTREVPQEIAPVHEVDLIAQEILHVFGESSNGDRLAINTHLLTLVVAPLLVAFHVIALLGVHAWEERGVVVFVGFLVSAHKVFIRVIRIGLDHLGIDGGTLLDNRSSTGIALHVAGKGLTEEKRVLAILLTVQILGEREDLIGRILVHRELSRRADDDLRKGGITDEDGEQAHQDVAGQTCVDFLPIEDTCDESNGKDNAEQPAVADKWHTTKYDTCSKEDAQSAVGRVLLVALPNAKGKKCQDKEEIEDRTGIERESKAVDRQA